MKELQMTARLHKILARAPNPVTCSKPYISYACSFIMSFATSGLLFDASAAGIIPLGGNCSFQFVAATVAS